MNRIVLPPKKAYRAPFVAPKDGLGSRIVLRAESNVPVSIHALSEEEATRYASGERRIASLASMPSITSGATFVMVKPGERFILLIESESDTEPATVMFQLKRQMAISGADDLWGSKLALELSKSGVMLMPDGTLARDPDYKGADQPSQEKIDLVNRRTDQELLKVKGEIEVQWAENLLFTMKRLSLCPLEDKPAHCALLFVRLHGWLADYVEQNANPLRLLEELERTRGGPVVRSTLFFFAPVRDALNATRDALDEDELLYAEYRRHAEAHLHQDAYEHRWSKKNGTLKQRASRFTGKTYDIDDLNTRLAAVIGRYGSEEAIADDFARRLIPHVERLVAAVRQFNSPQY